MDRTLGLDEDAWSMWIEYRKQIRKPLKAASMPLAKKRLAALGTQQREAVEHSIANGYQGLFAPKSAKGVIQKIANDSHRWDEMKARAEKIGFRAPRDGEDLIGYGTLVQRAEHEDQLRRLGLRKGPQPIAKLLGAS